MRTIVATIALALFLGSVITSHSYVDDWRNADRSSMGIAPLPEATPEAVVQVYAARTIRWRGYFAVHCWVAAKEKGASTYTTYQVMGFRLRRTGSAVVVEQGVPDRKWYGAAPTLLASLRGPAAERAIPKIKAAVLSYPYAKHYRAWPGPNSNTFVSHLIRNTPELGVELPPHAIGKDWIDDGDLVGLSESGTGVQLSLLGALGLTLGLAEGFEANLLGLTFGFDLLRPALKLPLIGRVGFPDGPVFDPDESAGVE
jgi:hypothetical protein